MNNTARRGSNEQVKIPIGSYCRMVCFALVGFVIFAGAAWLSLDQMGAFRFEDNPYEKGKEGKGVSPCLCLLFDYISYSYADRMEAG